MRRLVPILVLAAASSCTPLPPVPFLPNADAVPPAIADLRLSSPSRLEVEFSEPIEVVSEPLFSSSVLPPQLSTENTVLAFSFPSPPSPATEHWVETQVADPSRNQLRFIVSFYGLNPELPAMLINEFTTQGSGSHPDLVELRVLSDGNLAGACLFEGTPGNWEQRLVFPDVDVSAGDYIVVHFKPEGIPEETDETTDPSTSGGLDATPAAWDFWVPDGTGLSGNNGVISLCENPLGGIVDGVLYSNRTSDSDEHYRGFGSRDVMERADELVAAGAWTAAGTEVAPEDAVNPDPSTSTRSLARASSGADSNSAADWHVTPTRGLTPGATNTDEVYVP
jgi:hypothetical protein